MNRLRFVDYWVSRTDVEETYSVLNHPAGISWSIKETAGNSGSVPEGRDQLKGRNSFYTQLPKPPSAYSLSSFFKGKEWVRDRDVLHSSGKLALAFSLAGVLI